VLPPPEGWYLLDWGPIHNTDRPTDWLGGTNTTYPEFFDIDGLKKHFPVISAAEFYKRESARLNMPTFMDPALNRRIVNSPDPSNYKSWLYDNSVVANDCQHGQQVADSDAVLVHFPYNDRGPQKRHYRFFQCHHHMHKDLLHYAPKFYDVASAPIASIGLAKYSAIHLRRNEFQYQQAPDHPVPELLEKLRKMLDDGETLYIATDEADPKYLDLYREALAPHAVRSLADFLPAISDAHVRAHRISGLVEMVICAGARKFMGARDSTYSSGIQLLRRDLATHLGPSFPYSQETLFVS
jgi:hypothetical protein